MEKFKKIFYYVFSFLPMLGAFLALILYLGNIGFLDEDFITFIMVYFVGIAWIYVCVYIHIIIHEAGHLIFGLKTGYGFVSYRIGPIAFIKKDGKVVVRSYSLAGTAGQCLLSPPEMKDGMIPVSLYNWGGVIINGITSVISLLISLALPVKSLAHTLVVIFALIGLYVCFQNGIPFVANGVPNDGYNAVHLKDDRKTIKAFYTSLKVNELQSKGVRLKDMDDSILYLPAKEEWKNSIMQSMALLYALRYMDLHEFSKAREIYKQLLEYKDLVGIYKNVVLCDYVTIDALNNGKNADLSCFEDKKFVAFYRNMMKNPSVLRTEYAINRLVNQNDEMSNQVLKKFAKAKKNYMIPVEFETEEEIIEIINKKGKK